MVKKIVRDVFFLGQKSQEAVMEDTSVGQDLQDTLTANREKCVGMAANMIGVRKRIIIVNIGFINVVMYNPVILKRDTPYETAVLLWRGYGRPPAIRILNWSIWTEAGRSTGRSIPGGRRRSYSMRWIIWRG